MKILKAYERIEKGPERNACCAVRYDEVDSEIAFKWCLYGVLIATYGWCTTHPGVLRVYEQYGKLPIKYSSIGGLYSDAPQHTQTEVAAVLHELNL
ncbi:MAG: hypothetical protein ACREAU_03175 [Nitrosopumilaceae archaeon]